METLEEKIKAIEEEIRETPYHKGTQHHIGRLRARIARLKEDIAQKEVKGRRGGGEGFAQRKYGDATVVLVGPPSVGKSTLLNKLTHAQSKVAAYDFTTLEVIPGMMDYHGAKIQIFDIPGIIGGAAHGKGRGREILSVARIADLIILLIDAGDDQQLGKIESELYAAGLRLNQKPPEIALHKKLKGGIKVISSSLNPQTVAEVAKEFRLANAEIHIKGKVTLDDLIDSLLGNRVYLSSLTVANKIDLIPESALPHFEEETIYISAEKGLGLSQLKAKIWEKLGLIRIFLKPQGGKPDMENPLIIKSGSTVLDAARKIHGEFAGAIKGAKIWGKSATFPGQTVSSTHLLLEGDVVTFLGRAKGDIL